MAEHLQKKLLREAQRIGNELISKAKYDDFGMYWETMSVDLNGEVYWSNSENIYSGDAGIALYLAELANATSDENLKKVSLEALKALYQRCISNPTDYYAFYTGRAGVAYIFSLLADFFNRPDFYEYSVNLIKDCEVFLNKVGRVEDFLNGTSGTLFTLAYIHSKTNNEILEPLIVKYLEQIYHHTNLSASGVYWDRSERIIKGLCGISHGSGGVGLVFSELAQYFNSGEFEKIAKAAFSYENSHFDTEKGNWPDFRKGAYSEETRLEFEEEYTKGNTDFFQNGGDMAAWCHGAPGIGLSRLNTNGYRSDVINALSKTQSALSYPSSSATSFTLCHGIGGNSLLLLEAKKKGYPVESKQLYDIGERIIEFKKEFGYYKPGFHSEEALKQEDLSLFNGTTGIGYFLLQIIHNECLSAILNPSITQKFEGNPTFKDNIPDLNEVFIEKYFPKTSKYLRTRYGKPPKFFGSNGSEDYSQNLHNFLHELTSNPITRSDERIKDIIRLEKASFELDQKSKGFSYLHTRRNVEIRKAEGLFSLTNENSWRSIFLSLIPEARLIRTQFDWSNFDGGNEYNIQSPNYVLLCPTAHGILSISLSDFSHFLVEELKEEISLQELINKSLSLFDADDAESKNQILEYVLNELKEASGLGAIIIRKNEEWQSEHSSVGKMANPA